MHEITIKIHEEDDLYNPFDPDRVLLSDDVVAYIIRKYQEVEHDGKYLLHIISDLPVDETRVRENIRTYMRHEQEIESREIKVSTVKQIRLFLFGLVFVASWIAISATTRNVWVEVLSIIGSFSVYEAANIWIAEKPYIRARKLRLKILEKTEVRFTVNEPGPETAGH